MADTTTTNLAITKMETGSHSNTWNDVISDNMDLIDAKLGAVTSLAVTGGSVSLSASEQRAKVIKVSGVLASNQTIVFNATGGDWVIQNDTTGSFTVTAKISGQTGVAVAQGRKGVFYYTGTDIAEATSSQGFDTLAPTSSRGGLIRKGASAWESVALGTVNKILASDGTDPNWSTISALIDAAIGSTQGGLLYRGASAWGLLGPGTAGQFLKTLGAAANPLWAAISGISSVAIQSWTADGTYTPTAGMSFALLFCIGGGAGGGGASTGAASLISGGGGGAGSLSIKRVTAADVGASKAVSIGAAGAAGASGNGTGGSGGDTSIGSLCVGKGATGGVGASAGGAGGAGGVAGTGDITGTGAPGVNGGGGASQAGSGAGGSTMLGGGGKGVTASNTGGNAGTGPGGGGSGGTGLSGSAAGGAGFKGIAFAIEFIAG